MATSELVGHDRLETAEGESTTDPSEQRARRGWVTPLAFALAVIPLVVAAVYLRVAHAAYKPEGDLALIKLMTALPYGLLLFLTWSMACRERRALPAAVVVGTYIAQTHNGYVTLGLPLVALGAVWLVVATPAGTRRRLVPPALVAAVAGAVMWLPTLVDQVTNEPGNLGLAARWFREGGPEHQSARTLGDVWRVVSAPYAPAPEWIFGLRKLWPRPGRSCDRRRALPDRVDPALDGAPRHHRGQHRAHLSRTGRRATRLRWTGAP